MFNPYSTSDVYLSPPPIPNHFYSDKYHDITEY